MFIGCLILTIFGCKAQIIPVEEYRNYLDNEIEIPDGAYIKDVNNLLDKYVGTWIGVQNSKTYEFRISKLTESFLGITMDELPS